MSLLTSGIFSLIITPKVEKIPNIVLGSLIGPDEHELTFLSPESTLSSNRKDENSDFKGESRMNPIAQ